eukprot:CAMPEP_0202980400 /NCGR_PEP_ID=MMETSP1396-20130829/86335_1 /ASSEMBLY_ACC=CAM_ASM_000872 /TAXON_ID= /ORGANISM="Pseudokeronopsis sp., Strain Brazil" /LENGTH=47 /DNA_ID= /DNA_START= /DNA_END= /DNA_ORIENTATION=
MCLKGIKNSELVTSLIETFLFGIREKLNLKDDEDEDEEGKDTSLQVL